MWARKESIACCLFVACWKCCICLKRIIDKGWIAIASSSIARDSEQAEVPSGEWAGAYDNLRELPADAETPFQARIGWQVGACKCRPRLDNAYHTFLRLLGGPSVAEAPFLSQTLPSHLTQLHSGSTQYSTFIHAHDSSRYSLSQCTAVKRHLLQPPAMMMIVRLARAQSTLTRQLGSRRSVSTGISSRKADEIKRGGWKGTAFDGNESKCYIGGEWVQVGEKATKWWDVADPTTQNVLSRVPQPNHALLVQAVDEAEKAFESWSKTSLLHRQGIMLRYQSLIREHWDDLANPIVLEQGKTFADAKGDVLRGLQVVDSMCALPNLMLGDKLEVSQGMDTYIRKSPLGIGAAICPFNFPAMIPLWTLPITIGTGNTLIVKPSERDPGAAAILVELAECAGVSKGVVSILHGGPETVNFLCDEPRISAISFVGSDRAGKHIYDRAGANGKRVQANLGAKNHAILMPDANKEHALNAISGAAFGAAGQRCMALSVLVTVGSAREWVPEIIQRAKGLKVGNGFDENTDLGPVISPEAKNKIEQLIGSCAEEGGKILLDGRGYKVPGYPAGNWVGPTVLEASEGMQCHETEIFGPVLTILHTGTIEEAIELVNRNRYGNGASVFTNSGATARLFERTIQAGQIGVNVPIPVPLPMFSWSGNKGSVLGGHSLYGKFGVDFWTQNQTVTSFWRQEDALNSRVEVAMPTMR